MQPVLCESISKYITQTESASLCCRQISENVFLSIHFIVQLNFFHHRYYNVLVVCTNRGTTWYEKVLFDRVYD